METDVFGANLSGGEEGEKWRVGGGGFDGGATIGLLTLDEADDSTDAHAGFAYGLDGRDGGGSGGADIIDDEDCGSGLAEALDAAAGAVSFFRLAHQKSMQQRGRCAALRGGFQRGLRAGRGHVGDDGISAEGESADGLKSGGSGEQAALAQGVEDDQAGEPNAFSVERGGAAVDVVVAGAAGGKLEAAETEADGGQKREKLRSGGARVGGAGVHGFSVPKGMAQPHPDGGWQRAKAKATADSLRE